MKIYDGSNIYGIICDKAWFKIKQQDMALDMWFNPNNRSWQYYLNVVKMYNYSLFANGVVIAIDDPDVPATAVTADPDTISVGRRSKATSAITTPVNSTATLTAASSAESKATVEVSGSNVIITGKSAGSATITVTATIKMVRPLIPIRSL